MYHNLENVIRTSSYLLVLRGKPHLDGDNGVCFSEPVGLREPPSSVHCHDVTARNAVPNFSLRKKHFVFMWEVGVGVGEPMRIMYSTRSISHQGEKVYSIAFTRDHFPNTVRSGSRGLKRFVLGASPALSSTSTAGALDNSFVRSFGPQVLGRGDKASHVQQPRLSSGCSGLCSVMTS